MCLFGRKVVPAVNQVETNPLNQQVKAQENMEKYVVTADAVKNRNSAELIPLPTKRNDGTEEIIA